MHKLAGSEPQAIDNYPEWKALDELPIVKKSYDFYYEPWIDATRMFMSGRFYRKYTEKVAHGDYILWKHDYPEIQKDTDEGQTYYYFLDDPKYRRMNWLRAKAESEKRKLYVKTVSFEKWIKKFSEVGYSQYQMILQGKTILQMRHLGVANMFSFTSHHYDDDDKLVEEPLLAVKEQAKIIGDATLRIIANLRRAIEAEAYPLELDMKKQLLAAPRLPYWIVMP